MDAPPFLQKLSHAGAQATPGPWGQRPDRNEVWTGDPVPAYPSDAHHHVAGFSHDEDAAFAALARNVWSELTRVIQKALVVDHEFGPTVTYEYPEGLELRDALALLRQKVEAE